MLMKYLALLPLLCLPLAVSAEDLTLNTYSQIGDGNAQLTNASNSGFDLTYGASNSNNDIGVFSGVNTGTPAIFTQLGDTLTYSFQLGGIVATNNNSTPVYRVGFDFGSTAALRYDTSTGSQDNLRFGSNDTGNPFAQGQVSGNVSPAWSPLALKDIRFDDGNEIDVVVSLELVGMTNPGSYDYEMTVFYQSTQNVIDSNSVTHTFTGVDGNQVVSLFHVTNSTGLKEADAYTISNATLVATTAVPEPSSAAALLGLVVIMMAACRRRPRSVSCS